MEFTGTITYNFRSILQQIYIRIEVKKYQSTEDYDQKLNKKFGLDKHYNHDIIESIRFLLEDTEYALENFREYGLQGPTRTKNNLGERYLRLYGFLNTVYLQRSIAIQLAEIFKLPGKKLYEAALRKLPLIIFRSNAGAHAIDDLKKNHFRLVQTSIEGDGNRIQYLDKEKSEEINLTEELITFSTKLHEILLEEFKLVVGKLFAPESKNYKELYEYLGLIEHRMKGGVVQNLPKGGFFKL